MARYKFAVRVARGNFTRFRSRGEAVDYLKLLFENGMLEPLLFAMEEVKLSCNGRLEKITEDHLNYILGNSDAE